MGLPFALGVACALLAFVYLLALRVEVARMRALEERCALEAAAEEAA